MGDESNRYFRDVAMYRGHVAALQEIVESTTPDRAPA